MSFDTDLSSRRRRGVVLGGSGLALLFVSAISLLFVPREFSAVALALMIAGISLLVAGFLILPAGMRPKA